MTQQKSKTSDRPPRFGGVPSPKQQQQHRPQHGRKPSDTRRPPVGKQTKRPVVPRDNVRYAVIITNVENDFGKLHNAALPYHCGLRADYEETLDVERLVNAGGAEARRLIAATGGCGYAVRCRTETRSAEIGFYGPADADFSPMQLQKQPRPVRCASPSTSSTPAAAAGPSSHTTGREQQEDSTAHTGDASATAAVTVENDVQGVKETTAAATSALETLALRLRRLRYFEDRLPAHVHLPGHAAGEVLWRAAEDGQPGSEAHNNSEEVAACTGTMTAGKRPREGNDDDDGVDDAMSDDEEQGEKTTRRAKTEDGDAVARRCPTAKKSVVIRQFPNRQKDFVTAVAALSAHVPLRVVRRRLHDLPGYMSCWSLYEKHVRVVFRDAESLLKAKQLLDQFELDAGLRVSLLLSDSLSRRHAEFTQAQEAAEAEE